MENKSAKFSKHSSGFTLIELMIVIVIIAILSSFTIMSYAGQLKRSRDGKRQADLENIRSALEIYRTDCGHYPPSISFGGSLVGDGGTTSCTVTNQYMASVPNDPKSGSYGYVAGTNTYTLCANLEVCVGCSTYCGTYNYKVSNP